MTRLIRTVAPFFARYGEHLDDARLKRVLDKVWTHIYARLN